VIFGGYRIIRWASPETPDVYKIGMDSTWYPLALYGKEHCTTAFTTDLLFAIARNQSIKMDIVRTGHKRLLEMLDDEQVDGVLTSLLPDRATEDKYYFSDPYYRFGAVLVVRKESDIHSILELPKKRVGVKRSSPVLYRVQIDPTASIIPYENQMKMFQDLSEKNVDAILLDQLLLYVYFGSLYKDQFKVVTLPLTNDGLRLVTLKERYTKELIDLFNAGLKNLQEDDIYNELLDKWELHDPETLCED
jgi:polar amino acid transport system substrate-binding protein